MRLVFSIALTLALSLAATKAQAVLVDITALDVRGTGVFGHNPNVSGATFNGGAFPGGARAAADPIDVSLTYSNLDLDGDSTANDSVTFTLRWEKIGTDGGALASFGQGIDTGFGNLNDVQVSMLNVSGTTTDSATPIIFVGFTGAAIGAGAGAGNDVDGSAEINGTATSVFIADNGAFRFGTGALDFAPTPTVTFDNSTAVGSSVVARHYDLQFAVVPEPSAFLMLGLVASFVGYRRNRPAA